jgi:hypothetical protein
MGAVTAQRDMVAGGPFDPDAGAAYAAWRAAKLAAYPEGLAGHAVEVRDPRALTPGEREALLDRCRRANMAIYVSGATDADKSIPRRLGEQLGLHRLDRNWLADDDGISPIRVATERVAERSDYIPYTDRPIRWHTDGYYNDAPRRIRGMILHCVASAEQGGANAFLDHEIAYLRLRDADPRHVRALMRTDAMTIPAREGEAGTARPATSGPVFEVDPATGRLGMRYTARTRSIAWLSSPDVLAAVAALEALLDAPSPFRLEVALRPGMGIVCNNVLHRRDGFADAPSRPRLLYRARYHDRVAG